MLVAIICEEIKVCIPDYKLEYLQNHFPFK
jgi:hypothetical protein